MASKKKRNCAPNEQAEDFRIDIDLIFRDFMSDDNTDQYHFPPSLDNSQRKYVHEKCRKYGLKSKSTGKEPARYLSIFKKERKDVQEFYELDLTPEATNAINALIDSNPGIVHESVDNLDNFEKCAFGNLNIGDAVAAEKATDNPFKTFRESLPIFQYRNVFLNMVEQNQLIIISAETGSGKTTQIPQYLLESAFEKGKKCRVICTQPRRISTLSVSSRVAAERGETVGQSVGYQIKLESKLGPRTGIIYCTTGILLRTLMNGEVCFNGMTHIIVDEIHERDKFSDFLLICLRECLKRHPSLRIILMSATMDSGLYEDYFANTVQVLNVPGRTFSIKELFLEDILPMINYESEGMRRCKDMKFRVPNSAHLNVKCNLDQSTVKEMEEALQVCMGCGSEEAFTHIMQLILCDSVPVNFIESTFGYTALIVAAAHGNLEYLEQLINMGADVTVTSANGSTAITWAEYHRHADAVAFLLKCDQPSAPADEDSIMATYDASISDEVIDYDLIVAVVLFIHEHLNHTATILIFLPGYEDIMNCSEKIREKINTKAFHLCMMHGSMSMEFQNQVFSNVPNKQKVILATNVAETSITIDHVQYVIDTGRAKEKTYDSLSGASALTSTWISMASVRQRAGRAGRTRDGVCFHIFSMRRYESFNVNNTPEILRVPLHELCLQTKMLAPTEVSIAEFLSRALEPPSTTSINKAIASLVALGALDEQEQLTTMGKHLVQLSVEPRLGKMLIYATVFKCLDPVLTIVACLSHKDPFVLPSKVQLKTDALQKRKSMSSGSLSDHMCLLICFQMWQDAKLEHKEQSFCSRNFVSSAAMTSICGTRKQLLGQLRASGFVASHPRDAIAELNMHSGNWGVVKTAIAAGLYPSIAFAENGRLFTKTEKKIVIHSSSSLKNSINDNKYSNGDSPNLWLMFEEMSRLGRLCHIKCCTAVSPISILMVGGRSPDFDSENQFLSIDKTMGFLVPTPNIVHFRAALSQMLDERIRNPRGRPRKFDEPILKTLSTVMMFEEKIRGFTHPAYYGSRAKTAYPNHGNRNHAHSGYRSFQHNNHRGSSSASSGSDFAGDRTSFGQAHFGYRPYHRGSYQNSSNSSSRGDFTGQFSRGSQSNQEHMKMGGHPYFKPAAAPITNGLWRNRQDYGRMEPGPSTMSDNHSEVGEIKIFQDVAHSVGTNNGVPKSPCPIKRLGTNPVPHNRVIRLLHPNLHMFEEGR